MRNRGLIGIAIALVIAGAILGGFFLLVSRETPRPNVLWITMDSLRADHLGCTGHQAARTPNIDALAGQGALFTQCLSQASYTRISVPSMITGRYPFFTGVRMLHGDLDSSKVTTAELLSRAGYFTYGIVEPWRSGLFQGLEKYHNNSKRTNKKTSWCLEALDELDGRPFFIWLYYWDPHAPYDPPEEYASAASRPDIGEEKTPVDGGKTSQVPVNLGFGGIPMLVQLNIGKLTLTEAQRAEMIALYDAEIAFVDANIEKVVEKIKDLGMWDDTMVILNADHGEAFGEHGYYYHGQSLYEQEIRVPLIIKPAQSSEAGKVIDGPVRNMDVMPTILDYCGIEEPADLNGKSLRPFIEGDLSPNLATALETHRSQPVSHLMAYRDDRFKLIFNLSQGGSELYNLRTDPQERDDLLGGDGESESSAEQMKTELRDKLFETLGVGDLQNLEPRDSSDVIDPETEAQLRALGYVY